MGQPIDSRRTQLGVGFNWQANRHPLGHRTGQRRTGPLRQSYQRQRFDRRHAGLEGTRRAACQRATPVARRVSRHQRHERCCQARADLGVLAGTRPGCHHVARQPRGVGALPNDCIRARLLRATGIRRAGPKNHGACKARCHQP